jgi:hypothetical protein
MNANVMRLFTAHARVRGSSLICMSVRDLLSVMDDLSRYSMTRDGRLLDNAPMDDGGTALVYSKGQWVLFVGTFGELTDSIPITIEEAMRFCQDGVMPERVGKATMKARWQSYLENLEADGWRVKYKEHEGLRSIHWNAEAVKGGKRLTVTGATLEYVLMRLWQMS